MNFVKRAHILVVAAAIFAGIGIAGGTVLITEFHARYTYLYNLPLKSNLFLYYVSGLFEEIQSRLFSSSQPGLPVVRMYIPAKSEAALQSDLPTNIKNWQNAFRLGPDGKLKRVKIRHRGDNPINWAYAKKSWRVKTRKSQMVERVRTVEYVLPQDIYILENHLANWIARRLGVPSPRSRMIELFINEVPYGIYEETERLDESFLRNHDHMPVNIYKGEQASAERRFLSDRELFNNPDLWTQVAIFNQVDPRRVGQPLGNHDFVEIIDLIRRAGTSDAAFEKLKQVARVDEWATFSAFQTLVQSWHNDNVHNMRLLSDPWKGTVSPIAHDTLSYFDPDEGVLQGKRAMFRAHHLLFALYGQSSEFFLRRQKTLYGLVQEGVLREAANYVDGLRSRLIASHARDNFRRRMNHLKGVFGPVDAKYGTPEGMDEAWRSLARFIRDHEAWLRSQLETPPQATWSTDPYGVSLFVDGDVPTADVEFHLPGDAGLPTRISWDADADGRLSDGDLDLPFEVRQGVLRVSAAWQANRAGGRNMPPARTRFTIVSDVPIRPTSASAASALTGKRVTLEERGGSGRTPMRRNIPIIERPAPAPETWFGDIYIDGTRFVDRPVIISAGATIHMAPDASLIFRNRVQIDGRPDAPVRAVRRSKTGPWGVIALQGPATAGSSISHFEASGGSGGWVGSVWYTAMFSIHDTGDIAIDGLKLSANELFDDLMHVVYAENVVISDCRLSEALYDALDIDISQVKLIGCTVTDSGNDGVDLMQSNVLIKDLIVERSGDKGVSVGEGSKTLIFGTSLRSNFIGVESKDQSQAMLVHSDLTDNATQLNAYTKNWRYGGGGRIVVEKSRIVSGQNTIRAAKKSRIRIHDSHVLPPAAPLKKRIQIDDFSLNHKGSRSQKTDYRDETKAVLDEWSIATDPSVRGILP